MVNVSIVRNGMRAQRTEVEPCFADAVPSLAPQSETSVLASSTDRKYSEARRQFYEDQIHLAAEEEERLGLLPLTGSPDQVIWATTIRIESVLSVSSSLGHSEAQRAQTFKLCAGLLCSALWWIEHRDCSITEVESALLGAVKVTHVARDRA